MLTFNPQYYPYSSRRSVVYAANGMCCAGNPTVTSIGLQTMLKGGNAIDAAIAMAAAQPVVEPTGNGIGADAFAIIWHKGKIYGINGSGPAPKALSVAALKERGYDKIPSYGIEPIDVPGAPATWAAVNERFGRRSLAENMELAAQYAENGYPVSPMMSYLWNEAYGTYTKERETKPEMQGFFDVFCPNGRPLQPGEIFKAPQLAKTLREIGRTNAESFYRGELAARIGDFFKKYNGFLTADDLAAFKPEWVDPISVNYRGYDVWEIPPNGHGITVLMALKIMAGFEMRGHEDIETVHRQIEAMKLAMKDTAEYVTEPSFMKVTAEELLSDRYATDRRALITDTAMDPQAGDPRYHSTIYFCTADNEGNMVSWIQSNFRGFGSGVVMPDTGISFNDRAENFRFDENHANALLGGKRPYHTIIPAFLSKDGEAVGPFGIMGGFMQPQAHMQVVQNLIDYGMNPQQALDAPRWQWIGGKKVEMEQDWSNAIVNRLLAKGHQMLVQPNPYHMGRGQMILRMPNGALCGGTEKRTDGQIMCY